MSLPSGSEDYLHRLELAGLICWLAKDLGWVLLFPAVSFPAALLALCLETHSVRLRWAVDTTAELVHALAVLAWLLGNSAWMAAELLFEESLEDGRQFPWYHGPLLGVRPAAHAPLLGVARGLFVLGFLLLLGLYGWSAIGLLRTGGQRSESARETEGKKEEEASESARDETDRQRTDLVWGVVTPGVYTWVFIGPWMVKDFFWTFGWLASSMPFAVAAALLTIDCFRRFGGGVPVAELVWVVANVVWIIAECALHDAARGPRVLAGAILFADFLFVSALLWRAFRPGGTISPRGPSEDTYLFGGGPPSTTTARAPEAQS